MYICSDCGDRYHDLLPFEIHKCEPYRCHACGWLTPPLRHPDTGVIMCADCLADWAKQARK